MKANNLDPLRAKTRTKATLLIQDRHQPIEKISRRDIYILNHVAQKKERKINSTWENKKKRPEVIWKERLTCLKFLQTEEFKASIKNKKNQGKADFFERSRKTIIMKKKKKKVNQGKYICRMNNEKKTKKDNAKRTKK